MLAVGRYVENPVTSEAERGVIVIGIGMLDEDEGRADCDVGRKMDDG